MIHDARAQTAVKFCGLTRGADAAAASRHGAAFLGVIFAGGPRQLDADAARAVLDGGELGAPDGRPRRVGVVGRQPPEEVARLVERARLDVVQLHADPDVDDVQRIRRATGTAVWAVLRVDSSELPARAAALFAEADAVVLDAKVAGGLGGSGVALDWPSLASACAAARGTTPLVLAGGLTPLNVAEAIAALEPDVVDVSSGVESTTGWKDHDKLRDFAAAVVAANAARSALTRCTS